jgi:predicted Zn finger-like uncharacterized protein
MPEIVSCPQCQAKIRLAESALGRKVRCAKCGTIFSPSAPAPVPAAAEAELASRPASRSVPRPLAVEVEPEPEEPDEIELAEESVRAAAPSSPPAAETDWSSVATGLSVQAWSHVFLLVGVLLVLTVQVIAYFDAPASTPSSPSRFPVNPGPSTRSSSAVIDEGTRNILMVAAGVLLLLGWLIAPLGGCYCLTGPSRRGALGAAIANLFLGTLIVLVLVGCAILLPVVQQGSGSRDAATQFQLSSAGAILLFDVMRLTLLAFLLRAIGRNLTPPRGEVGGLVLGNLTPLLMVSLLVAYIVIQLRSISGAGTYVPDTTLLTILNFAFLGAYVVILVFGLALILPLQRAVRRPGRRFEMS